MTYQPDFSGVWAKIERAKGHSDILKSEVAHDALGNSTLREEYRVPMRLEYEPETGHHVFRATTAPSKETIRLWGLIVGDAVHNLRGALDHMVWQLARFNCEGQEPPLSERVQFPITDTPLPSGTPPESFASAKGRALWQVRPDHRAIIYKHQPYGGSFDYSLGGTHPFLRLKGLSNDDKHRVIAPVAVLTHRMTNPRNFLGADIEYVEIHGITNDERLLEPNAEVVRVKARPASLQLNMEVAGYVATVPSFRDVMPDGTGYVRPVYNDLFEITLQVLEVVREFHQLFK